MTNQQGAPEALHPALIAAAQAVVDRWDTPLWKDVPATAEYIGRLRAALVEAQQPAPSAAAAGEVPLPLLVRDIAADLGTTPIQVCTALATLGFGGHSVNMAVTPRMAKSLRAHFASTTPQADSQPAAVPDYPPLPTAVGVAYFLKGELLSANSPRFQKENNDDGAFNEYNVEIFTANEMRAYVDAYRAARAPADSVTAPAGPTDAQIDACARSMLYQPWGIGSRIEDARAFAKRILSKFAHTPPAQAADSVLEDAARESEYRRGYRHGYEQRDAEVRGALS